MIDAVITWVDGNDPAHARKLNDHLASIGAPTRPRGAHASRFAAQGEIDWCVISLLRFAPWLRRIHIVTDAQTPSIVERLRGTPYADRVVVVDHRVIFAGQEQYLPSFNSSAILCQLWKIPDLAEQFLFLNDDFALLRPVQAADFFRGGQAVLRGQWRAVAGSARERGLRGWLRRLLGKSSSPDGRGSYRSNQEASAALLGYTERCFQIVHNPHPWRVSSLREFFAAHPEVAEHNLRHRLRVPGLYSVDALAAHLELKRGAHIDNRLQTLQLKPASQSPWRIRRKIAQADRDERIAFVCVQNLERGDAARQRLIVEWLGRRIGSVAQLPVPA